MTDTFVPMPRDDDAFVPLGVTAEPLAPIDRAAVRSGYRLFRGGDGFEAAVPQRIIDRIAEFARDAAPKEWCGLVVGQSCEDENGRHVVVLGVVPDADADTGNYSVKTSHESEFRTRFAARALYPDGHIIGWVHTHPRLGLAFSGTDFRNQGTWTQPHSLGLVVDPWHADQIRVYRGPKGEVLSDLARACAPSSPAVAEPQRFTIRAFARAWVARVLIGVGSFLVEAAPLLGFCVFVSALAACWLRVAELDGRVDALEAVDHHEPDSTSSPAAVESHRPRPSPVLALPSASARSEPAPATLPDGAPKAKASAPAMKRSPVVPSASARKP